MKKIRKQIWLSQRDWNTLTSLAEERGFKGKGSIGHYLEFFCSCNTRLLLIGEAHKISEVSFKIAERGNEKQ